MRPVIEIEGPSHTGADKKGKEQTMYGLSRVDTEPASLPKDDNVIHLKLPDMTMFEDKLSQFAIARGVSREEALKEVASMALGICPHKGANPNCPRCASCVAGIAQY